MITEDIREIFKAFFSGVSEKIHALSADKAIQSH
jgi:hypothetical protein